MTPSEDVAAKEGLPFAAAPGAGPEAVVEVPTVGRIAYRELTIAAAIVIGLLIPLITSSFVTRLMP